MVTSGVSPCDKHKAHAAVNIQLAWELNESPNTPWTGNLLQDVAARGMYIAADAKPNGRCIHNVYIKLQWHSMHDHPLWVIFLQFAFVSPTQSTQNVFGMQPTIFCGSGGVSIVGSTGTTTQVECGCFHLVGNKVYFVF